MRPIQLQMSGLQSYRELQTIDFSQLVGAGVFGIFGPTGSGKSSILDAITLSLYGKVERASGGTQAIMNHAEQTLFVSFTFELTNAAGTERYRVERQFKRGTEMSINGTIARLLHVQENETIVLADKAGEVNQRVLQILGLSMQDFTRAVVLPQGKFAEFLTLTGKDRRQMLQRLFHLEQYGDQLSAKVSSKVKETDSTVKQLAAEQLGLGDASELALQAAKDRLHEAEHEVLRSRLQLEEQEKCFDEQKQIVQWQQEKGILEAEAQKQQEQEPQIREKELLLGYAEKAEKVRPYLEQHELASKDVQTTQTLLDVEKLSQHRAEASYQQASERYEQAQQELSLKEGPLLLRLDQLQQALVIQQELDHVQQQIQTAQHQENEVKAALATLQADIKKSTETKQKAVLKQTELKDQLKLVETNTATTQLLHKAIQEKKTIEQLRDQQSEAQKAKDERARGHADQEQYQRHLADKHQAIVSKLHVWREHSHEISFAAEQQNVSLNAFIPALQVALEHMKRRWKMEERHALAAILASELTDGEHCPVCGATEHPSRHLRSEVAAPGEETEVQLQQGETLLQRAKERQFTYLQQLQRIATVKQQAAELASQFAQAQVPLVEPEAGQAWKEAAPGLEEAASVHISEYQADLGYSFFFDKWMEMEGDLASAMARADELEQSFQTLLKEHASHEQRAVQAAAQQQAAASLFTEAEARLAAVQIAVNERSRQWQERYTELIWEAVDNQLERQLANERLAEELRGRIEKSIPFLDELIVKIDELQRAAAEQDRTALQLHERLQGLAQLAADKSRQLAQRAPGAAVPQLIAEATSALEQLRLLAQQTKLAHATAQREQSLAAQRYSAAAEAAAAAARQLAQSERALHGALAENGFASREAEAAAALAPEQRRQWALLAAEHREREQALRVQLAQLAAKLQGRVLSADAWAQTQALLSAAKAAADAALESRAKAAQGASELAVRHARWCELEALRAEQAKQLERLGKLQSVLKANAFVEYLAEEQLMQVSRAASERLGELTRRRYAIEVDSGGGFVIRDDANGGVKRPVSTLSGGETFLTSLALALALSAQIQLKGEYPLEFFFLDEGFGTLDQELLDMVIGALEKLHMDSLSVGVISHVPELRARLARKLIVQPAEPSGRGSRIMLEEQ
ncbi:AAA family ATPase [Paenibacillus aceris]|uniref:Nuclease SbcCD subunit C n=1 Tax=Paenibacillus aceris TaxID=869555 RepID=A0ABS4HS67_9BACL|nr:SMC family ATPase [Paenibacillus aceris]MBP1961471.1 exonuclease SbcC [Paenibacillus aceris]NHW37750.1 SMC family ATPase [Paenibacillus aceris]